MYYTKFSLIKSILIIDNIIISHDLFLSGKKKKNDNKFIQSQKVSIIISSRDFH